MEDKSKILDKIKKLFKLSSSSNENEAALALQRAKELMEKYSISASDLSFSDIKEVGSNPLKIAVLTEYKSVLLESIARLFECEPIVSYVHDRNWNIKIKPVFLGVEPNPTIAAYCFDVLNKKQDDDRRIFLQSLHKNVKKLNKTKRANEYALGWALGIYAAVRKLVPVKLTPVILTSYIESKKQDGLFGEAKVKPAKVSKGQNELYKGLSDGRKVELNKGMAGGFERKLIGAI